MTRAEIDAFLATPRTAVLSSLDRTGAPHMSAMWFLADGDSIEMWTYAKSQKAVNVRRDPRVAVLVEHGETYDTLQGVLVRGRASLVEELPEVIDIGCRLYERYTMPRTGVRGDVALGEIERQARKRIGLRLDLSDVASWDHGKL